MQQFPDVKDIILVGGGHSHALVIRMWAMNPIPGIRLTLISPQVHTPYSGMLPGLVAGHYNFEQTHIDLQKVCAWAGVRFIKASATKINADNKTITLDARPNIEYDICSIDIGSTPNNSISGFDEFAVGVKPISRFYSHWQDLQNQLLQHKQSANSTDKDPFKVVIIGGGAGGIELITAMQHWSHENNCNAQFTLLSRGKTLLADAPKGIQKKLMSHLLRNNIGYKLGFECQTVSENQVLGNREAIEYHKVFYCTQACAAPWLQSSGLELNKQGFININDQLQSTSHKNVFAAGDISHQVNHPRPKAGVYAVRMAPVLFSNLINSALNKPLKAFKPQSDFLSLLALGGKFALGSRKPFSFSGKWAWALKDHIDVKFMNLFHQLPAMDNNLPGKNVLDPELQAELGIKDIHELAMRCGGCGGKVGASVLSEVLQNLQPYPHKDVLIGLSSSDDAAVLNIPSDKKLVQTIDHLKTLIDDPYLFGKLSALHALSDAFAMNAKPQSAQALVQLPMASENIQKRDMSQLMQGALEVLNQHECALVGGHTSEDTHLNLGFCINALAEEKELLHKQGAKTGEVLILTQPLGTGALFAAHMRGLAKGNDIQSALNNMLQSNQSAAQIFHQFNASACTDVTGFGLLGHLVEMLKGSDVGATINMADIPVMAGTLGIMQTGIFSSLQPHNVRLRRAINNQDEYLHNDHYPLLFDPQTCGGLLACVNVEQATACLNALKDKGYTESMIIGEITALPEQALITLK
ncbi:MAG: selenide, water dikinase SelD [Bermanella sp.]